MGGARGAHRRSRAGVGSGVGAPEVLHHGLGATGHRDLADRQDPPVLGAGPTTSPTLAISSGTSTAYNFEVDYRGVWYDNSTLTVAGMSATNTGMILNLRGANATETVTLSFSQPIRELTFVVYELNRWTTTTENDTLSFSQPVAITGTGLNATTGTGPFFRTATYSSLTAITVRTTATAAFSTFAITYLDAVTASTGGGYVGIGDLTICV